MDPRNSVSDNSLQTIATLSESPNVVKHGGLGIVEHSDIPLGTFRSGLLDCVVFPQCLVSAFFPFVIWAQVHKYLWGGTDGTRGMKGYYLIIITFAVLYALSTFFETGRAKGLGAGFYALYSVSGVLIVLTLLKRIRQRYHIRGNECQGTFSCCNDGCYDFYRATVCLWCTTFQIGDHVFNYRKNFSVTYEPVPVGEMSGESRSLLQLFFEAAPTSASGAHTDRSIDV